MMVPGESISLHLHYISNITSVREFHGTLNFPSLGAPRTFESTYRKRLSLSALSSSSSRSGMICDNLIVELSKAGCLQNHEQITSANITIFEQNQKKIQEWSSKSWKFLETVKSWLLHYSFQNSLTKQWIRCQTDNWVNLAWYHLYITRWLLLNYPNHKFISGLGMLKKHYFPYFDSCFWVVLGN